MVDVVFSTVRSVDTYLYVSRQPAFRIVLPPHGGRPYSPAYVGCMPPVRGFIPTTNTTASISIGNTTGDFRGLLRLWVYRNQNRFLRVPQFSRGGGVYDWVWRVPLCDSAIVIDVAGVQVVQCARARNNSGEIKTVFL